MTYIYERNAKERFKKLYDRLSMPQQHIVDQYYEYLIDKDTYVDYPDDQFYALLIDFVANRFIVS